MGLGGWSFYIIECIYNILFALQWKQMSTLHMTEIASQYTS